MSIYQPSFFDEAECLVAFEQNIDFELFRPKLTAVFEKPRAAATEREAYDVVLMFKILILQQLYKTHF